MMIIANMYFMLAMCQTLMVNAFACISLNLQQSYNENTISIMPFYR